jgi:hypothetical protein
VPISSKGNRGCAYRTSYEHLTRLGSDERVTRRKFGIASVWTIEEREMGKTDLRYFESGQRARDRESDDDSQMLVLGAHGKTAKECYISAIGQSGSPPASSAL